MTSTVSPALVARAHRATDPLHSMIYFAPEADEEFAGVGLRPGRMSYFAGRAAPMGPVTAPVVAATFYNFNPSLVAHMIPRAWTLAAPEDVLLARLRAVDRALTRLLGPDGIASPEVAELADLARRAAADLPGDARPLYAAHAALPWPDAPHIALWHAVTLLREYRGDGHLAALLDGGLSGLEALITHTATGRGFTEVAAKASRGWKDDEWDAGAALLRERGILDGSGGLTAGGVALRDSIEAATDRLGARPWHQLDEAQLARLVDLGKQLCRRIAVAGAWPDGVFSTGR